MMRGSTQPRPLQRAPSDRIPLAPKVLVVFAIFAAFAFAPAGASVSHRPPPLV